MLNVKKKYFSRLTLLVEYNIRTEMLFELDNKAALPKPNKPSSR